MGEKMTPDVLVFTELQKKMFALIWDKNTKPEMLWAKLVERYTELQSLQHFSFTFV